MQFPAVRRFARRVACACAFSLIVAYPGARTAAHAEQTPAPVMRVTGIAAQAIGLTWTKSGDAMYRVRFSTSPIMSHSDTLAKRSCHNTTDVEESFADYGFAIVYPEDYSLGDQVRLFRGADVIAGFVGSGLFNLCYVMKPTRVIMVGSTAYTARNEYLMASVLGHQIDSIACVPDDPTFYQSPFTFDPETDGRYLRTLLDSL